MRQYLDLSAVAAFILVAEMRSFTHAAQALGLTQAGVSLKLRRLEQTIGRRLLERTPRLVRLSSHGEAFLPHARALLAAQERALMPSCEADRELAIAISDHVAGPELPEILARVHQCDPSLILKVRIDYSRKVLTQFDDGEVNVAVTVAPGQGRRCEGELLFEDEYGWFASLSAHFGGRRLPLVTVTEECAVRGIAIQLLNEAKIPWADAFLGGGMGTVLAAARSAIGVVPLPRRLAITGLIDVGCQLGLPPIPSAQVAMYSQRIDGQTRSTLRMLSAAFRSAAAARAC